jgi:Adenylate and Guanylate cyclase catalytic domain
VDVRDVLPLVRVPTLVLQRAELEGIVTARSGRYLAERIPGARLVELPGRDLGPMFGDKERLFNELEAFLVTIPEQSRPILEPHRVLATVLFTDIVDATARAAQLGDRTWRALLEEHHELVRSQLHQFRGREVDTAGDGFFATFDGPARAIRCACAIRNASPNSMSRSVPASTQENASWWTARPAASPYILGHASPREQNLARSLSQAPSRISSPAQASPSTTVGSMSSRASPASGGYTP